MKLCLKLFRGVNLLRVPVLILHPVIVTLHIDFFLFFMSRFVFVYRVCFPSSSSPDISVYISLDASTSMLAPLLINA